MQTKIYIVDDDTDLCQEMKNFLNRSGFEVRTANTLHEAKDGIKTFKPDILLQDLKMPDGSGLEMLNEAKSLLPEIVAMMFSGYGTVPDAVEAMKRGAENFLTKPIDPDHLLILLQKIEDQKQLKDRLIIQELELATKRKMIIGKSDIMQRVIKTCQTSAKSEATILINGETGTGKHLLAHFIHQHSDRTKFPFVYVNCATLSEALLESDLFGHEKGAFTGAIKQKRGRIELANKGTLFLDEIAEIPLSLQAKLLHFIEYGEFQRVGGTEMLHANTRIICATNRNLSEEIKAGNFREDLFYRINVIEVQIPPLRERRKDIPVLIDYFIEKFGQELGKANYKLPENVNERLMKYSWPGNIRELQNAIERAMVLCPSTKLSLKDFPFLDQPFPVISEELFSPRPWKNAIYDFKKKYIEKLLQYTAGNQTQAAKILDIQRTFLSKLIKDFSLKD
jgi:DNA-binding NtrC family response regulator